MPRTEWARLIQACRISGLSQNRLYRLAAIGELQTRDGPRGTEFYVPDLKRVREQRAARAPTATAGGVQ